MDFWNLPTTLEVGGEEYEIRTDFRAILDILTALTDPELPEEGRTKAMVEILYPTLPPVECLNEAVQKALWFIDCGRVRDGKPNPVTMDWEHDAPIIFPAVNKIAGYETRNPNAYTHWWTFLGYFDEISDGLFSQVLAIRQKRAKGKKLEKWEQEFLSENRALVEIRRKASEEDEELLRKEQDAVDAMFR